MSVETNRALGRQFFAAQDRLKGGPDPDLCTNQSIDIGAIVVMNAANGKVTELRGQFDQMGMMRQLGVMP